MTYRKKTKNIFSHICKPVCAGFCCCFYFFLLIGLVSGCNLHNKDYQEEKIIEVNGVPLTAKYFSQKLTRRLKVYDAIAAKDPQTVKNAKELVIKDFIIEQITLSWAQKKGLQVSTEELNKEVDKLRGDYPDDLSFKRALTTENISFAQWKKELEFVLLQHKVHKKINISAVEPSESEMKSYYEIHKQDFDTKPRIHIRQIVSNEEEIAKKILKEIQKKKTNFTDLAKKFSITPESTNGGDVGWIEKGVLDIFDKAFKLSEGSISSIMKSDFGYHIIEVIKKDIGGKVAFAEAKAKIRIILLQQNEQNVLHKWLEEQIRQTKVLRNDSVIDALFIETKGGE